MDYADTSDDGQILAALRPNTKALYIETPSNPMMNITDLRACAKIAKERQLLLIVDNTFLSPYLQNPLELGADIVLHSGSKFLSGHNDTIAGFLSCASRELADRVRLIAKTTGGVLAPFDCWLVLRGIKTLSVRMERQQENAAQVAQWLVKTPGVVFALAMAVRALTQTGDRVLIQSPVYYPFFSVIRDNDRVVVENELRYQNGRYFVDFEDFERKIVERQVKLFILCSPHNPVGRVWTLEELQRMGEICQKNNVYVVSDEIHCDFAFEAHPHHIFLAVNPALAERTIVCTAPSKTFNLAGLQVSNIWIPGQKVRTAFLKEIDRSGYSQLNSLGLVACQAAYTSGEEWLEQCRAYLRENLDYLRGFLAEHIPQITLVEPEGTYFAWLDCSKLRLSQWELNDGVCELPSFCTA